MGSSVGRDGVFHITWIGVGFSRPNENFEICGLAVYAWADICIGFGCVLFGTGDGVLYPCRFKTSNDEA